MNLFEEIIVENILNLWKETVTYAWEAQRVPSKMNLASKLRYIIIKMAKIKYKGEILKGLTEK